SGRCDEAIDVADRAFAARLGLGDQEILSEAGIYLVARSLALGELGRLLEAAGNADAGYEGSVAARYPSARPGSPSCVVGSHCSAVGCPSPSTSSARELPCLGRPVVPAHAAGVALVV
ncbi:MAG: hypothetical protein ACRDZ2_00570, partial [Ilumatobacteraceae bacterium]